MRLNVNMSDELFNEVNSIVDYVESINVFVTHDVRKRKKHCKELRELLSELEECEGRILINRRNVSVIQAMFMYFSLVACVTNRSYSSCEVVYACNKLLSFSEWKDEKVDFAYINDNTEIYEMNIEQLSYYLYWRKQARKGVFGECTERQLWTYTYDLIFNTCFLDSKSTLANLIEANKQCGNVLSTDAWNNKKKKHNKVIADYTLWNLGKQDYNSLPSEYKINDDFDVRENIHKGNFDGSGHYFTSLLYLDNKLPAIDKEIIEDLPELFELIFTEIYKFSRNKLFGICDDLTGKKDESKIWKPFQGVPVTDSLIRNSTNAKHNDFSIGGDKYKYRCLDGGISNYYHSYYYGATREGRMLISYIFDLIRNHYRMVNRMKKRKVSAYPYKYYEKNIEIIVAKTVSDFKFSNLNSSKNSNKSIKTERKKNKTVDPLSLLDPVEREIILKYREEQERQKIEALEQEKKDKLIVTLKDVKTSIICMTNNNNIISNNLFSFGYKFSEPVDYDVSLYYVDELGEQISNVEIIKSKLQDEPFKVQFSLLAHDEFKKKEKVYLLAKNNKTNELIGKLDYYIDIAFTINDFGF